MGRGDYYRGDYYRGSIFGTIGRAISGTVGGAVSGFIKGGPIGGIFGALGGAAGATVSSIKADKAAGVSGAVAPIGSSTAATPVDQSPEALIRKHQINIAHAQAGGKMIGRPGAGAQIVAHPVTGQPVLVGRRHRTMRVTNPKALRRALRRAEGFKKLALRTIKLIDPRRKAKAFAGFKRGRKR